MAIFDAWKLPTKPVLPGFSEVCSVRLAPRKSPTLIVKFKWWSPFRESIKFDDIKQTICHLPFYSLCKLTKTWVWFPTFRSISFCIRSRNLIFFKGRPFYLRCSTELLLTRRLALSECSHQFWKLYKRGNNLHNKLVISCKRSMLTPV